MSDNKNEDRSISVEIDLRNNMENDPNYGTESHKNSTDSDSEQNKKYVQSYS